MLVPPMPLLTEETAMWKLKNPSPVSEDHFIIDVAIGLLAILSMNTEVSSSDRTSGTFGTRRSGYA